jgi:hypothetical protein
LYRRGLEVIDSAMRKGTICERHARPSGRDLRSSAAALAYSASSGALLKS